MKIKYAEYGGITETDSRKMRWYMKDIGDPLPGLGQWTPPRLEQYLGDGKRKRKPAPIGDAPSSGPNRIISQRAADALRDIWDKHALLYPVILDDDPNTPYYMVVCQTVIDCLDVANSTGKGRLFGGPDYFVSIHTWSFFEDRVGDNDLFMLPYSDSELYVTERFKERVVAAKLKGFCLARESWDDKPFIS